MKGCAVLHPMGWDAFGLPAENEAIHKGLHPRETTSRYAANYRRQMTLLGCSYDWEREINSSAPEYYRWTQRFFLLLYERGLAYRAFGQQWWCPACKTVLANEQIEHGSCWRCHGTVYRRRLEQWYFRITAYAEELLAGLDTLDWPEHVLAMQRNWIGRSEGVSFSMEIEGTGDALTVFTTRIDTVFGMTFAVLAPEHPLLKHITRPECRAAVESYCADASKRSDVDRSQEGRGGVFTGAYAINPVNGSRVPVYTADYVLMAYGSGAVMAVPAHDRRDFDFARAHRIPVKVVVAPPGWNGEPLNEAFTEPGAMVNSGQWDGLPSEEAGRLMAAWMERFGIGRRLARYRMRDWLISRQRYWGAPIPIVYCGECGIVPVPLNRLPVLLPDIKAWMPGGDGRSPLANVPEFVNAACPRCGGPAKRETDTMDGFACSSWYFLRFVSPQFADGPFDPKALSLWGAPDLYMGGAEQAVMHLLYARFWTKVMADAGIVPFREPFPVLRSQGIMHVPDPQTAKIHRMSKSAGNVVTPDDPAAAHGADALRAYLLFMAPFESNTVWEEEGMAGAARFLERTWRLINEIIDDIATATSGSGGLTRNLHRTIQQVTGELEKLKFNTAIAALMELLNAIADCRRRDGTTPEVKEAARGMVLLMAPFVPHIAEELWARLGGAYSVHEQAWPEWNEKIAAEETVTLVVQVNGRVRARIQVPADADEEAAKEMALSDENVLRQLGGRNVQETFFVRGKLINLVTL